MNWGVKLQVRSHPCRIRRYPGQIPHRHTAPCLTLSIQHPVWLGLVRSSFAGRPDVFRVPSPMQQRWRGIRRKNGVITDEFRHPIRQRIRACCVASAPAAVRLRRRGRSPVDFRGRDRRAGPREPRMPLESRGGIGSVPFRCRCWWPWRTADHAL
jgi:hypothetical protein